MDIGFKFSILMQILCQTIGIPILEDFENVLNFANPLTDIVEDTLNFRGGSKLSLLNMLTNKVLTTPDGGVIREGDIVTYAHPKKLEEGDLWPDGLIPFTYHESVDNEHKFLITEAMKHWANNTCLRFKPKKSKDRNFIRFRTDTSGCWSSVGRQFFKKGPQDISLGAGCFKFYTAVHEIGHTIGYYHEHARQDRDNYIHILWDNLMPGMNVQFEHKKTRNEMEEYDYRSIMHYPAWAFSKSPLKYHVILAKNPFLQYMIDEERDSLSFRDIKLTNALYKCDQKCENEEEMKCQNRGYLAPEKGKKGKCVCKCPRGFTGNLCENKDENVKIDRNQPKCGGYVTEEGTFSTPNYPKRENDFESCAYWIRAPIGQKVEVTFEDFSFGDPYIPPGGSSEQGMCLYENVEIRITKDIYSGVLYCGQQIAPKTVITSETRDFIIIIVADSQKRGRGFKARVKFLNAETSDAINANSDENVNNGNNGDNDNNGDSVEKPRNKKTKTKASTKSTQFSEILDIL